ncbi:helix-hairpin-helix domain-containing protein [Curtobacterium sp. ME-Dv--P-122a]|uniref:ComEA family DNA-binding protein n=1 Tax=Curtobacterium sp. ME-Dv--P-122a TaxID=3040286 RepID=UPI00254D9E67|nr:helix-hairpin-helix domain-containing protein [Curtobacterium sp. ME-Dv--P-122a]
MNTPEERLCSRSWRLRHSSWVLWSVLTFGLVNAVGFWIVAAKTKRLAWILIAVGWTVIDVLVWVLSSVVDTGTKADPSDSIESTLVGLFVLANWAGGIVHAFLLRKSWLRWRAHHQPGAWYSSSDRSNGAPTHQPMPMSRQQADSVLRNPEAADYRLRSAPPAPEGGGRNADAPPSGAWRPPQPVDVNRAGVDAFRSLGLTPQDAQHIVLARDRLGGFRSKDQLMTAAGLPPHVYLNLQHLLVLGSQMQGDPSTAGAATETHGGPGATTGRRLDL